MLLSTLGREDDRDDDIYLPACVGNGLRTEMRFSLKASETAWATGSSSLLGPRDYVLAI